MTICRKLYYNPQIPNGPRDIVLDVSHHAKPFMSHIDASFAVLGSIVQYDEEYDSVWVLDPWTIKKF